jgi:hypothetical protein
MSNTFSNKATTGQYRVVGYDQYDYSEYFIDELPNLEQALRLLKTKCAAPNATPTSFSDVYFIYNDKEEILYKGTFDNGIEQPVR